MKLRLLAVLGVGALAGALGCSSDAQNGVETAGGGAGVSGAGNPSGAGGLGGAALDACAQNPLPQRTAGTLVSLPLQLVLAGKPFVFGQPNAVAGGGTLVPTNLRFYISEVQLLRKDEQPVSVDLVTEAGAPEPYGVHFFNAEEEGSSSLRLLAPAGEYTGLSFALGIKLSCNQQSPSHLSDPFTDVSQMTWPGPSFLFLRYEGLYRAPEGDGAAGESSSAEIPPSVHMGGSISKELVPRVTAEGALSVPANGRLEKALTLVVDEIFQGATSDTDISDAPPGPAEVEAGERLRRELPTLRAFVLEP